MTTIAIDPHGVHIAADGLITAGGAIEHRDEQKIRVVKGKKGDKSIYVLAGTTCMFDALIKWHQDGADAGKLPPAADARWSLVVIDAKGPRHYGHLAAYPERITYPYTVGTGYEYAMGALKAGASAQRAVEIACEIDIHSGGEIQVVNIKEALGMAPRLVETA